MRPAFTWLGGFGERVSSREPTVHYVAGECARGITELSMQWGVPIAFGVLTTDTLQQAIDRAGTKNDNNKGAEAAVTAIEMANLLRQLGG